MTHNGKIPHWFELTGPTPLVERGGQRYHDDVPVQPVEVLSIEPISAKGGRKRYTLEVAGPDGPRRVYGQEVENFSGRFIIGRQQVLCQVAESGGEPSVGGELCYTLMPVKPTTPIQPAAPNTPTAPKHSDSTHELNREDELVCWSIAQASQSLPPHSEHWDESELERRSRSLLGLHERLRRHEPCD